jgi:hypothetical protein
MNDISDFLYKNDGVEITLVVYNSHSSALRLVPLIPNQNWGGKGIIGCQILHGVLSRIPKPEKALREADPVAKAE